MNEAQWVQMIALVGWLILCVGALASFRLSWKKSMRLALIWSAIFAGAALFIDLVR